MVGDEAGGFGGGEGERWVEGFLVLWGGGVVDGNGVGVGEGGSF